MIGGLLDKVSASLGKSFIFAGLLPAAVLLSVIQCYRYGFMEFWGQLPTTAESLQKITGLGVAWLSTSFILFSISTWIFGLFQEMPTGRLGPLLLRRWSHRRDKDEAKLKKLEWEYTVAQWRNAGFDPAAALYVPPDVALPSVANTIRYSIKARTTLEIVAGSSTYPGWHDSEALLKGLRALFAVVADAQSYQQNRGALNAELGLWRAAASNRTQDAILNNLSRYIEREWAVAYEKNQRYAKGSWLYPTAIGNRLAALDDYSQRRYGIPTVTLWDRLWWVLPAKAQQEVSDARLNVEALLNLSAVLWLCAIGIAVCELGALSTRLQPYLPPAGFNGIAIGVASAILAMICYRGAIFAFRSLATKMSTLIDTNRLQLLAALGYKPETVQDEIVMLGEAYAFFVQALARPRDRKVTIPKAAASEKDDKDDKSDKTKQNKGPGKDTEPEDEDNTG